MRVRKTNCNVNPGDNPCDNPQPKLVAQHGQQRRTPLWFPPIQIQIPRIEQAVRLQISHGRKQRLFQVRVILLDFAKKPTNGLSHRARPQRTTARHDRRSERLRKAAGDVLGHESQRANQPKLLVARVRDWWQRAYSSSEQSIAQERFAKIIRRVAESNDVGAQPASNLIHSPPPVTAAQVATVIGLFFQEPQRGLVLIISPSHAPRLQILTQWFNRPQKLALLHGKRAHRELHRRSLTEQKQGFEQG